MGECWVCVCRGDDEDLFFGGCWDGWEWERLRLEAEGEVRSLVV